MVIACSVVLPHFFGAFIDSCASASARLCQPFPISLTNLCIMHRESLLPCNNDVIWVRTMAYLLPFILGTYFSGAFITRVFRAAIPVLGSALSLTGLLAFAGLLVFFGLVVGSEFGAIGAPWVESSCPRLFAAIAVSSTGTLMSISTPVGSTIKSGSAPVILAGFTVTPNLEFWQQDKW